MSLEFTSSLGPPMMEDLSVLAQKKNQINCLFPMWQFSTKVDDYY